MASGPFLNHTRPHRSHDDTPSSPSSPRPSNPPKPSQCRGFSRLGADSLLSAFTHSGLVALNTSCAPKPLVGRSSPDLPSELCIHTSTPHMTSPLGHLTRSGNSVHANEVFLSEPPNSLSRCFPSQDVNPSYTQLFKPETWKSFSVPLVASPPALNSSAVPSTRAPPICHICPQLTKCDPAQANITSHLHISQSISILHPYNS